MPRYLQGQGALTYMIPPVYPTAPLSYQQFAEDLDGLVLVGGVDVCPTSYGEKARRATWRGDSQRDAYDIALFNAFHQRGKPIFGICRGLQLINVALGGSLYQDISSDVQGALVHRDADQYEHNNHRVVIKEQGLLARLYGPGYQASINSVHHQGIKKLGNGLRVEAVSPQDGIIEAVSFPRSPDDLYPRCFAVQWHPEFQKEDDDSYVSTQVLLTYFMEALAAQAGVSQHERSKRHA
jgi:putative glutamine amidotransferase